MWCASGWVTSCLHVQSASHEKFLTWKILKDFVSCALSRIPVVKCNKSLLLLEARFTYHYANSCHLYLLVDSYRSSAV